MSDNIHTLRNSSGRGRNDNSPLQVLFGIPIVTRYLISSAVVMTLLIRLRIVKTGALLYQFNEVAGHLQVWRPFTSCLILPFEALPAMLELYTIYSCSSDLESRRKPLDYLFYLVFCVTTISLTLTLLCGASESMVLTSGIVSCLTFTWSMDNSNVKVLFYGLFPVWGKYYPILQLFMAFAFGNRDYVVCLVGFLTGYLYACLDTGTLGPFYGWLVRSPNEYYGIFPNGKFGAPQFIKSLLQESQDLRNAKSSGRPRGGQKLGFKDTPGPSSATTSAYTASPSSSTTQRAANTATNHRPAFFPGNGQRLGS
ncbi:hypothetical protein HG536_0A05310 [Torulaspora globosa]|uniref:Derlin n=1 Tax=Torulaspora globosa TaxID=48254 RepID=A0A7G3ZB30_9SACH|nr:uncharacterized protein HG536_0A05310 [Torulaspora globosa]QLL30716.1 hypothetical protein HG536_0A05310 [Torulaspora globosa]